MRITERIISALLCMVLIAGTLTGCTTAPAGGNSENQTEQDVLENPSTEISVTDQAGRTLTLEKPAEKIVSVYYISTALLVALGCEDNLVGIEMKADTRELYRLAAPQLPELPAVGSGKGINVESIAALSPDLVVIPAKLADSAVQLEQLGITVAVVNPETQEDFIYCAEMLGALCGKTENAEKLVEYYDTKADEMAELTKDAERPAVYLSSGSSYFSTCTSGMYQTELIDIAGGVSVSKGIEDTYWQVVSPEQLAAWNPEYMFAVTDADYTLEDIYADEALSGITAVKEGRVYTFPSEIEAWDYPTASSVLGVMWLTSVLHPELYPEEQYIAEAKEFYKTFFDIEVDKGLLGLN